MRTRTEALIKKGAIVELIEKKPVRTSSQNRYLHSLLGYLAVKMGCTLEWVKREYYKTLVNPSLYFREKEDAFRGTVSYLRSSSDLTTEEMTTSIERLRNWASEEAGIYLPSADEYRLIQLMEIEIERNKQYI
jgi:hypothetical protein